MQTSAKTVTVRVTFAWWVRPYLTLCRFGAWLDLPLDHELIARDTMRGCRCTLVSEAHQ